MPNWTIDQLSPSNTPAIAYGTLVIGLCTLLVVTIALPANGAQFDHSIWDRLLAEYVDDEGRVDYEGLEKRERQPLEAYLSALAAADVEKMTETQRLAFWINAYNAGIVAAILEGYSPESPLSRAKLFLWYSFAVAGKQRTPNDVEHEILRKQFSEPRIHFALVCAATSCPKLRREAYVAEQLDEQLDDQARRFINDPRRNRIEFDGDIRLSTIFEWFAEDFAATGTSVPEYVGRYVDDPARADALRNHTGPVEYLEYDWALNRQAAN